MLEEIANNICQRGGSPSRHEVVEVCHVMIGDNPDELQVFEVEPVQPKPVGAKMKY